MGNEKIVSRYLDPNLPTFISSNERAFCRLVGGQSIEDGQVAALVCVSEGISVMDFVRTYHLIKGKPAMKADAMLAAWRVQGGDHELIEQSPARAAIALIDEKGRRVEFNLAWEVAEQSRFPWRDWEDHSKGLKDNWATPLDRQNMLWARVISSSVRSLKPEIVSGIYTPEELTDVIDGAVVRQPSVQTAIDAVALAHQAAAQVEPDEDGELVERCTADQLLQINQLYEDCGVNDTQRAAVLAKRGASALADLSAEQAAEVIDRLVELKKRQGSLATAQTG